MLEKEKLLKFMSAKVKNSKTKHSISILFTSNI
ncbi:hypothetical protein DEHRE_01275 [Dehalobacter restrictus DSM 9455]|uniref:Uncharacterized protein n=1 Tax=Dehalobacter restrictus (strain DSM 9455 / PER-K23) TaxID=871738 RepID=A0ABM5P936_DEHRP|nr:hypothetical protein DEHRE_01275 [Dehalobacter restrictus DSM 9455]